MAGDNPAFRRGGRPRMGDMDKRGEFLRVRVRPDEKAMIEGLAAATNRPLPDYVRDQALSGRILVKQFQTLSALDRHDLARIGSNLNQIARVCNATGDTHRARNIEALLGELRDLLNRLDAPGDHSDELGEGTQD